MDATQMSFEQLCEMFNYTPKGRLLSTAEAAELSHHSKNTFEINRVKGIGPRYFQPPGARRVLYSEKDVLAWVAAGARMNTSA
jgi:hypothetical protein